MTIQLELNNPKPGVIRVNTFTHDDVEYDLDYVRKAVKNLPRVLVKVSDCKWLLDECKWTTEDSKRYAYLGRPVFIVRWQDKICIVDGYHRLHRAVRTGLKHLPAIWVPEDVMSKAKLPGDIDVPNQARGHNLLP